MGSQKAFLIDGTAFCYRAFYAIRTLSTSEGRPTNAVYGFVMMLQALREKEHPDYLAVAFDVGKPTFRHERFEAYKGQRKPMPEPLIGQLPLVKALLSAYRLPIFEREGYEAEDVLATLAKRIAREDLQVFLVTGDKDALQLVNSHLKVYNPHKEQTVVDADAVKARYGVGPASMVDLMALMGDEIDNIPGVPGIGEKTAVQLLQQFGTLEALYRHLDQVKSPTQRAQLAAAREQVTLSRELVRIDPDVPLEVSLEDLRVQEPDGRALRSLFRELEFKRLLSALDASAPVTPQSSVTVHAIADASALTRMVQRLRRARAAALGCWPVEEALVLALTMDGQETWVLQVDQELLKTADGHAVSKWLADPNASKITHDAKSMKHTLARLGLTLAGLQGDTMVAAYLLNPARTNQRVCDLVDEYLERPLRPVPPLEGLQELAVDAEILQTIGQTVTAIWTLHERFLGALERHELLTLYRALELPLIDVLWQMEQIGVGIDVPYLTGLRAEMGAKLSQLADAIYRMAGGAFNLNSPKQLAHVLFERLQLPVIKRTKTGPSTDSDVLRQLADRHPVVQRLMEYRELAKLVSTYVEALPQAVNPSTGRLHTTFNQTATATGRLSSSEPNLQNIPIKTELGRSIRQAFVPSRPDDILVAADYSQIELRILAHLSSDEHLVEAFRQGRDIHRFSASLIYGLPETEVQPEQRNAMKAINYGILYGMSAFGLSKELGVANGEAQAFIEAYFQRYSKVRGFLDEQIAQARRAGFVQTLLGRRRYIPEIQSPDPVIRQFAERMAVNAPIQGTAADLIKQAMVTLAARLPQAGLVSRMILQVHDELVFEGPRAEQPALVRLVREVMEGAIMLRVPLVVTIKAGSNWLNLAEVK